MKIEKKKAKSKEMFDSLIVNAINFLEQSVLDLEEKPKYSVINFCTAVELFLKARLMLEHWSLIYEDPKTANFTKFLQGNFKSIGMLDAIRRLKEVLDLEVTKDEEKCFDEIREHRNQLIHFFNKSYTNKPDAKILEAVVSEECKGWFYLHQILTKKWKGEFEDYAAKFERINRSMIGNRKYLKAKFDALSPDIERRKKQGIRFSTCRSCGYDSCKEEVIVESLVATDCMICEMHSQELRIPCINCQGSISITGFGEGVCETCETSVGMDYLLGTYAEFVNPYRDIYDRNRAYCNYCEYIDEQSVVPFGENWLCLFCLEIHDDVDVGDCDCCCEFVAGNLEDNFFTGCLMCDGKLGRYMEDDD